MVIAGDTPGRTFYRRHLQSLATNSVEDFVDAEYHPDAFVMAGEFVVQGGDRLKRLFGAYLDAVGPATVVSVDRFEETEDAVMVETTTDTEKAGRRRVFDVFVLTAGKISQHFTGILP